VNNAGISSSSVGDPDGLEGWHRIIAVNQTSVFLGTKLAAEQMAKTGGGSIVNISSIMGFVGSTSGHPAYHASKGAVRIYSKAAAVRYGPSGVRVNTVHPGYMPPMLNSTNAGERADKIAATPLRRIGKPIEVAYGVLFLASDEASFITGASFSTPDAPRRPAHRKRSIIAPTRRLSRALCELAAHASLLQGLHAPISRGSGSGSGGAPECLS
jgi:NAD(P)-dependent dehydrogenase (short-subunit alcohol dehydrogenase family)